MNDVAVLERQTSIRHFFEMVEQQHPVAAAAEPSLALFDEDKQSPLKLEKVFADMAAQGYQVGDPYRHYPSRRRGWAEWHVKFTNGKIEFALAWLLPEDVA